MEPVTIHAKMPATDDYGDATTSGYDPTPALTLAALVAPNHDPLRIAVGRESQPVQFDIYVLDAIALDVTPETHVLGVRGQVYELDRKPAEWNFMNGQHAGDHFTVTRSIN